MNKRFEAAIAWFTCRPLRLLWVLPAVMAMDSPGCVMSEQALTRFRDGAIDTSLFGEWSEPNDESGEVTLWIGMSDSGMMEVRNYDSGGVYLVLRGYTSSIGERSYANLQFADAECDACSEDERAALKAQFREDYSAVLPDEPDNDCTWLIVKYELIEDQLTFWLPEPDVTDAAIAAGTLSGRTEAAADDDASYAPCVTSPRRTWRRFVRDEDGELFPDAMPERLWRRSAAGAD